MKERDKESNELLSGGNVPDAAVHGQGPALRGRSADERVSKEDIAEQVDTTRQQLAELQRRREDLEREKNELEELRRKQAEYEMGRKEMLERLTRSLVILEQHEVEVTRLAENVMNARVTFAKMKDKLEGIREEQWSNANLKEELTKALALVDIARNEFNHYRARIDALDEKRNPEAAAVVTGPLAQFAPKESPLSQLKFGELIQIGLAITLPILVLGVIFLIIYAIKQ